MHCKHIVKYFTLLLVFSAGLAWTDPLTSGTTPPSPSMLIPKCEFI